MFKLTFIQKVQRKLEQKFGFIFKPVRRLFLKNSNFSIISNNCWGGVVYEYYGLPKNTPTAGVFFMAEEYLRFIENLPYYLSMDVTVIPSCESRHYQRYVDLKSDHAPVGVLDDVEFVFLHYLDPELAAKKWNSRRNRVNYSNLILKFSYMNDCTIADLYRFDQMKISYASEAKKICFINQKLNGLDSAVYIKGHEDEKQISNDTSLFKRWFFLTPFLNGKGLYKKYF